MHRIRRDVDIAANDVDRDDNKIVDVLHIFTNAALGEIFGSSITNDKITRGTASDFIGYMTGKAELAVVPTNLDLGRVSALCGGYRQSLTYPLGV
jgi:hypothetical protein